LVELLVVIAILSILLVLGIPALAALNRQSRVNGAIQTINSTLVRANFLAVQESNLTAVRFMPAVWDFDGTRDPERAADRQLLMILTYSCNTMDPQAERDPNRYADVVRYNEVCQRAPGFEPVELPHEIWAAPYEALLKTSLRLDQTNRFTNFGADFVLKGAPGQFSLDARPNTSDGREFFVADDYLLVFDPRLGLKSGVPQPFSVLGFNPTDDPDERFEKAGEGWNAGTKKWDRPFMRYNFSGVTVYDRSKFALDGSASGTERQASLAGSQPFLPSRFSGTLVQGPDGSP
jgi:hypothetical protein